MMRFGALRRAVLLAMFFGLVNGCSCGEDPPPGGGNDGSTTGNDGSTTGNDGSTTGDDGSTTGNDGSTDNDGSMTGNDGSVDNDGSTIGDGSVGDGGNPLEQPLSEFCRGEGTVVIVGGGGECAGQIAQETFQFGLCACESISGVQSRLEIDAFDSTLGTYGATLAGGLVNILDDGHLGINGELNINGKLLVHGSSFVGGGGFSVGSDSLVVKNAYAAGSATQASSRTEIGRNAFFDGNVGVLGNGHFEIAGELHVPVTATVSSRTNYGSLHRGPIPAVTPCPCRNDQILDVPALTAWAASHNDNAVNQVITSTTWENGTGPNTITLPCGRYYITRINHPGGLTVRAEGRTVLFVDGDMTIGGGLNLEIDDGAEIDLFIAGNLSVQAAARLGDQSAPSMVRTYIGGSDTINMAASAVFGGNLYAPRADVVFGASANLYGALFAKSIVFSGSAQVHFDSAVRSAGDSCEEPPPPTDGGVPFDAGFVDGGFDDMGNPIDGGVPDVSFPDAAPPPDAGEIDAGFLDGAVVDTGINPDAGPPPDAGPDTCMSCTECPAPLGCVKDPGATDGLCAPCVSDLDCCPPLVCSMGQCIFDL